MEVSDLPQMVRNAGRLHEVISVLAKYGLAPWLSTIDVDWLQKHFRSEDGQKIGSMSLEQRVRLALAELGTTFIKLGQVLSTRADLVGPKMAAELSKLQAGTPADTPEQVHQTILQEFGKPPEALFAAIDLQAFASASIGQVHRARLQDGTEVVVKVQHQGIEQRIENDLEILLEIAKLAETYSPELAQYRPYDTTRELKRTLLNELNFGMEQRNLVQFANNFAEDPGVQFPPVFAEFCTRRVLTMGLMQGISLSQREQLVQAGYDLTEIARQGANMFLQMVFRDGFYHADPHPGNLMVQQGQVIGVLDCGMVGRVDEELREQIEDMLMAAVDRDANRLLDAVVELGEMPPSFDRSRLQSDLLDYVEYYGRQSLNHFDLAGALNGMTEIIRQHHIILPSRVSLLIKMLVMLDGTARQLSPDFSIAELLEPYRAQAIQRRLSPQRIWRRLTSLQRDWTKLAESFPADVSDIINRMRRGSFDIHLEHRKLDTIVNRLVMGLLTAALFMGSASLLSSNVKPTIREVSVPGAMGCAVAVYLGVALFRAIKKSGDLS
ncbi:MAG: AarF/UbiB family protein [bacterium]|nr:AarF/UbiB family protein [bacterium]